MSGFAAYLDPNSDDFCAHDVQSEEVVETGDLEIEVLEPEEAIRLLTASLEEPRFPAVVAIFNGVLKEVEPIEVAIESAQNFVEIFRRGRVFAPEGITGSDYVRECVRGSFSILHQSVTEDQFGKIALRLEHEGFALEDRTGGA